MKAKEEEIISIILPIYNTPIEFLLDCLISLQKQDYSHFECIMIDDGSCEEIAQLCDEFVQTDDRFFIHHQKNSGVSAARNAALTFVSGDYLTFIDADDILKENAFSLLIQSFHEHTCDCICFGWLDFTKDSSEEHTICDEPTIIDHKFFQKEVARDNYACGGGYPWNKIWRISAIKKDDTFPTFLPELDIYEDKLWVLEAAESTDTILLLPDILYQYRFLPSSLTQEEALRIPRLYLAYHAYDLILDYLSPRNKEAYYAAYNFYFEFISHDLAYLKTMPEQKEQYKKTKLVFSKLCKRIKPRTLYVPIFSKEFLRWLIYHFLPILQ